MKAQVVSFHCVLKNSLGKVLSTTFNQDVITQLPAKSDEIPGLAARMTDLQAGERRRITVPAQEAYGLYEIKLTQQITRDQLTMTETLAIGDRVQRFDAGGNLRIFRITEIAGNAIYLDANHPFAGQDLIFEVHVLEARDATAEEICECIGPELPRYLH